MTTAATTTRRRTTKKAEPEQDMSEPEAKDTDSAPIPWPLPTVFHAWNAVMNDVQSIGKESRNTQQNFNFRGIDAVLDAVGPVLRKHGVAVVPTAFEHEAERYTTKSGGQMLNRVVQVTYTVYGPQGDSFTGSVFGEAADSGDKAMSKAHSVALRTFLLQALTIPTGDPEPDASSHERATPATAARAEGRPVQQLAPENAESKQQREDLKAVATENGWDLGAVAKAFEKGSEGKQLREASPDEVVAFTNSLVGGLVSGFKTK
ncbi:ERF family protein [Mycobacteroides abscessus]|nr:ERF family protein [Mycobacteroides abscessus]